MVQPGQQQGQLQQEGEAGQHQRDLQTLLIRHSQSNNSQTTGKSRNLFVSEEETVAHLEYLGVGGVGEAHPVDEAVGGGGEEAEPAQSLQHSLPLQT